MSKEKLVFLGKEFNYAIHNLGKIGLVGENGIELRCSDDDASITLKKGFQESLAFLREHDICVIEVNSVSDKGKVSGPIGLVLDSISQLTEYTYFNANSALYFYNGENKGHMLLAQTPTEIQTLAIQELTRHSIAEMTEELSTELEHPISYKHIQNKTLEFLKSHAIDHAIKNLDIKEIYEELNLNIAHREP